eukprot:CAMPEP_0176475190 /NCGR_PEP_ID=MMETSP0127-20121128/43466_1 /TAXON_ID=938130 /ORGANISM="Platyophrya macrostoma, Strain WH" /LENGTH=243 /DNA_ID=CAMNT_0017870753 /DNA_START=313 /DNA_END=1041 /DNA_ORIENTATION=+
MTSVSSLQGLVEHLSHSVNGRSSPPQQPPTVHQQLQHAVYAIGGNNTLIPVQRGQQVAPASTASYLSTGGPYSYAQAVPVSYDSASGYFYAAPAASGASRSRHKSLNKRGSVSSPAPLQQQPSAAAGGHHHHHHHGSVVADVPAMQSSHLHVPVVSKLSDPLSSSSRSTANSPPPAHPPASLISVTSSVAPSAQRAPSVVSNLRDLDIRVISKKVIGRVIIVGDVHGCPDQLRDLAKSLHYDP